MMIWITHQPTEDDLSPPRSDTRTYVYAAIARHRHHVKQNGREKAPGISLEASEISLHPQFDEEELWAVADWAYTAGLTKQQQLRRVTRMRRRLRRARADARADSIMLMTAVGLTAWYVLRTYRARERVGALRSALDESQSR